MLMLRTKPTHAMPRTETPAVAICIANWNCRELLRACLKSLYERPQGVPFEVIIADNGSTDGAVEMIANEFPQVRLIRNDSNRGFAIASNQAASVAKAPYLFFLNNDTELPANTLRKLVRYLQQNPGVGMAGPRLRGGDGHLQISYRRRPTLKALLHRITLLRWTGLFRQPYYDYRRSDYTPHGEQTVEILMGAAVVLHRDEYHAAGGWDEHFRFGVEDIDLSTQVAKRKPVVFLGDIEITHHGRAASRDNIRFAAPNVAIGYVRYLRKCGVPRWKLAAYKMLVTLDAPLQWGGKLVQAVGRRLRGQQAKAKRSTLAARGLWHFMTGELPRFWKA